MANLSRRDGVEFLAEAQKLGIVTNTTGYRLIRANEALADLRAGRLEGAAVLVPSRVGEGRAKADRVVRSATSPSDAESQSAPVCSPTEARATA